MKTETYKKLKKLVIALLVALAILSPITAGAKDVFYMQGGSKLIYQDQSASPNIFGYVTKLLGKLAVKPELVYTSQANGPAIHSYAQAVKETSIPWNVEYVDTSNGPAIYSYERLESDGGVKVLPIVAD